MSNVPLVKLVGFVLLLALGAACDDKPADAPLPAGYSRVAAVKAQRPQANASRWCDLYHEPGRGPALRLPRLVADDGGNTAPLVPGRSSWINLWATWCKPCLREMPLLGRFRDTLAADGRALHLVFISLDDDAKTLAAFMKASPQTIPSPSRRLHLADPGAGTSWLTPLGLRQEATIPIHLLVGGDGKLRCVRAGSISDGDYRTVRGLLDAS